MSERIALDIFPDRLEDKQNGRGAAIQNPAKFWAT